MNFWIDTNKQGSLKKRMKVKNAFQEIRLASESFIESLFRTLNIAVKISYNNFNLIIFALRD